MYCVYHELTLNHQNPSPLQVRYTSMGSRPYPVKNPRPPHLPLRHQFEHIHPELMVLLSRILPEVSHFASKGDRTTHAEDTAYCRGFCKWACILTHAADENVAGSPGNRPPLVRQVPSRIKRFPLTHEDHHNRSVRIQRKATEARNYYLEMDCVLSNLPLNTKVAVLDRRLPIHVPERLGGSRLRTWCMFVIIVLLSDYLLSGTGGALKAAQSPPLGSPALPP